MKKLFTVIAAGSMIFVAAAAGAQSKIGGTVEVKKDFDKDLTSAGKPKMKLVFSDTLRTFNLNFNYKIFDKPFRDMYEFSPIPSAQLHSPAQTVAPQIIAKIGLSYPISPVASVYIQPKIFDNEGKNTTNTLRFMAEHKSYWDNLPLSTATSDYNSSLGETHKLGRSSYAKSWNTNAAVDYDRQWKSGTLNAELFYANVHDTYYGLSGNIKDFEQLKKKAFMNGNLSHEYNQGGIRLKISSLENDNYSGKLHYDINAEFQSTADKANIAIVGNNTLYEAGNAIKLTENRIKINGEVGPTFGKYSMVTLGFNSETSFYTKCQEYHYSLLELTPTYSFNRGRWNFSLGVRLSAAFKNKDNTSKYFSYFSPRATVSYELMENKLWAYGVADGGNETNSYASILQKNRWAAPFIDIRPSSSPLIAKAGVKGIINKNLSYDVYAGYAIRKGMMQFYGYSPNMASSHANSSTAVYANSALTALYSNHRELMAGGSIDYKSSAFNAGAQFKYSNYTKGKKYSDYSLDASSEATLNKNGSVPFGYAPFEASVYGEYNWRERIYAGVNVRFRSRTRTYAVCRYNGPGDPWYLSPVKVAPFADISLYGQYVINTHLTAFAQVNNLLNAKVQYIGMYIEKTVSAGIGVLVKF